jgi:predicted Zn-dependent peptidase
MARAAAQLVTTGKVRTVPEQLARWEAVGLADVLRVAGRVLGSPRIEVTVGPV